MDLEYKKIMPVILDFCEENWTELLDKCDCSEISEEELGMFVDREKEKLNDC